MTVSLNKKAISYIGLAQRAGGVLYGEDIILNRIKLSKVVLIDDGATDKYKRRLSEKITVCPVYIVDNLRQSLHKDNVNSAAITNAELAKAIIDLLR